MHFSAFCPDGHPLPFGWRPGPPGRSAWPGSPRFSVASCPPRPEHTGPPAPGHIAKPISRPWRPISTRFGRRWKPTTLRSTLTALLGNRHAVAAGGSFALLFYAGDDCCIAAPPDGLGPIGTYHFHNDFKLPTLKAQADSSIYRETYFKALATNLNEIRSLCCFTPETTVV